MPRQRAPETETPPVYRRRPRRRHVHTPPTTTTSPQTQRDPSTLLLSTPTIPNPTANTGIADPFAAAPPVRTTARAPPIQTTTRAPPIQTTTRAPRVVAPVDTTSPSTTSTSSPPPSPTTLSELPPPPNTREISTLATWTLSSHKPGCGISSLRHPSPSQFWQSDGPQPHTLTLHFFKRVAIVAVRVYLDIEADESYTPTKMGFWAGMSEGGLVEFGGWEYNPDMGVSGPRGWVSVDLSGVGGREGGSYLGDSDDEAGNGGIEMGDGKVKSKDVGWDVLKCMVLQVRIMENHQNGKDTHVRGFQVFARDERRKGGGQGNGHIGKRKSQGKRKSGEVAAGVGKLGGAEAEEGGFGGLEEPDWMGEPELR